jgi:hypothetical protein
LGAKDRFMAIFGGALQGIGPVSKTDRSARPLPAPWRVCSQRRG